MKYTEEITLIKELDKAERKIKEGKGSIEEVNDILEALENTN